MKKIILSSAVLALFGSANTYASQARLLALGMNETDNEGSYYISDVRNMFLNPAYINLYANTVTLEWGSYGQYVMIDSTSTTKTSAATLNVNASAPKAQGGFLKKGENFVYGVYLGNESNTSSLLRIAGTSAVSTMNGYTGTTASATSKMLQTADNQVDVFFGGESSGLKWAANALAAAGKDETRSGKDSAYAVRGGVIGSGWDAHLNLSLASKAEATDTVSVAALGVTSTSVRQEFKGKLGFQVGGSYVLPAGRLFGYVKHYGWEQTDGFTYNSTVQNNIGGQSGTVKGDFTSTHVGWGHNMDVNNGDKVFTSLAAKKTDINLKFSNKSEVRHLVIPVTVGYEAKAAEWLTLRGSFIQNLWGTRDNKNIDNYGATGTRLNKAASASIVSAGYGSSGKSTIVNSTTVNAGATLTFGNLDVDGLIGTTATDGTASSKKGVLSLENLETSVAMTYKF